jgi:putative membrane protein
LFGNFWAEGKSAAEVFLRIIEIGRPRRRRKERAPSKAARASGHDCATALQHAEWRLSRRIFVILPACTVFPTHISRNFTPICAENARYRAWHAHCLNSYSTDAPVGASSFFRRRMHMSQSNNLNRTIGIAALAIMFGAGSVYAQSSTSTGTSSGTGNSTSSSSGSDTAAGTGAAAKNTVSRSDASLMRDLAQANISEIEAAKLAQSKTKNDQVKQFAQKMIDDHTKANQELEQLAQQKGVKLPTEPDMKHKASMKLLSALDGDKFDKRYMSQGGLSDHRNTHKLLARVQDRATDPDLKSLAAKLMPVVDQHLTMAQEISGEKSAANMSGSSQGPAGTSGMSSGSSGSSRSSTGTSGSSNSTSPSK